MKLFHKVAGNVPSGLHVEDYILRRLQDEGLLFDPRTRPLAVLGLLDVEILEGLSAKGYLPGDLLHDWKSGSLSRVPFVSYIAKKFGRRFRPPRVQARMEEVLPQLVARLRLKDDPSRTLDPRAIDFNEPEDEVTT